MADEDGISQAKLAADLDHVVSVSGQSRILSFIVRSQVRTTCSYVVKQNDPEIRLERWRDKPPHVLIAAEPMGEHHRFLAGAPNIYIIAFDNSWHAVLAPWAPHVLTLSALGRPCDCSLCRGAAQADKGAAGQATCDIRYVGADTGASSHCLRMLF